jgi:hypothetical protein
MLINDGIKIHEVDVEMRAVPGNGNGGDVLRQQFNSVMLMAAARSPALVFAVASQHTRSATCLQYAQLPKETNLANALVELRGVA